MSSQTQPGTADVVLEELQNAKVRVEDGDPVLELPSGPQVRLNVHVTEWTHEEPERGEAVSMDVDTDYDDYAWWSLYPERSDLAVPTTEQEFPHISIEPEIKGGDGDDG